MKTKALETIAKYKMFTNGDKITVGVSGGADSVALLVFLHEISTEYKLELMACHVNHCLRGEESDSDQSFVEQLCHRLNIPLKVYRLYVGSYSKEKNVSIELAARELRYKALEDLSQGGLVATAHTQSDNLETILFSIGRGAGLKGMTGIPPVRDNIIRPLINCSRDEIESYLLSHSVGFVIDSSNLSDDYSRNKIRHNVIPSLKSVLPNIESSAAQMTQLLEEDNNFIELCRDQGIKDISEDGKYSRTKFLNLHNAIKSRVLIKLLQERGFEYSYKRIALMEECIQNAAGSLELAKHQYFKANGDVFFFANKESSTAENITELHIDKTNLSEIPTVLLDGRLIMSVTSKKYFDYNENGNKKHTTFAIDYDKIEKVICIRNRKNGDNISLAGRNCSKSLKKLFNEAKIPLKLRNELLVLADDVGPLFIEGFGADERCVIDNNSNKIIIIKIN